MSKNLENSFQSWHSENEQERLSYITNLIETGMIPNSPDLVDQIIRITWLDPEVQPEVMELISLSLERVNKTIEAKQSIALARVIQSWEDNSISENFENNPDYNWDRKIA